MLPHTFTICCLSDKFSAASLPILITPDSNDVYDYFLLLIVLALVLLGIALINLRCGPRFGLLIFD